MTGSAQGLGKKGWGAVDDSLEDLVLIDNLDAVLVVLLGGIFADRREMGVHHEFGGGGMFDVAGSAIAVDLE
jgi:hypothetical protein